MSWRTIKIKEETKEELDKKKREMKLQGFNPSYDDLIKDSKLVEEKEEKEKDFMEIF